MRRFTALLLALGACTARDGERGAPETSVAGEWRVTAYEQPGITALSPEEAERWVGRSATFSDTRAAFADHACGSPRYTTTTMAAAAFGADYRVAAAALGLGNSVTITRVDCGDGSSWAGSTLVHRGDALLAPWDGTWFVLEGASAPGSSEIGAELRDGSRLTYESGGTAQAPWVFDSVRVVARDGFDRCVVVARQGQPVRESCVRGDTLYERRAAGELVVARPIAPGMNLDVPAASGAVLHYATEAAETVRIGDRTVRTIPTTILTTDSTGTTIRRLRERYAPALLTAVTGVFEEPDGAGGWRATLAFSLARIEDPEQR